MSYTGNNIRCKRKLHKKGLLRNKNLKVVVEHGNVKVIVPHAIMYAIIHWQTQNDYNSLRWPDQLKNMVISYFRPISRAGCPLRHVSEVTGIMETTLERWFWQ